MHSSRHSRQPGADTQQVLIAIHLPPEPCTQPSQGITWEITSVGPHPSQEMRVTQGWQSDQNSWWIGSSHHPITHEKGGKNCQGRSVRCGEGNFWQVINAKKPTIIQVLPREMGSYINFFYDSASLPPLMTSSLQYCRKASQMIFSFPKIQIYISLKIQSFYTLYLHTYTKYNCS